MFKRMKTSNARKCGAAEAKALAGELEQLLDDRTRPRFTSMLDTFEHLEDGWADHLEQGAAFVMQAAQLRQAIRGVRHTGSAPPQTELRFQTSSLFLKDAREFLIADPQGHERMVLFSGTISSDGTRVVSRMVHVETEDASAAYVRAEPKSTHKTLVDLCERDGHRIFAMAHSHVMSGVETTRPSGIDLAHQARFCASGLDDVLGCIFNLTGHVRFFSTAHDFDFSVYGNGVEIISTQPREKILRIV